MRIVIVVCLLFACQGCARQAPTNVTQGPSSEDLRWETVDGTPSLRVVNPGRWNERFDADTKNLQPDDEAWQRYLVVLSSLDPAKALPILGTYRRDGADLVFTLRFPPAAEVLHHAYFDATGTGKWRTDVTKVVGLSHLRSKPPQVATTAVRHVYPSTDKLPENQLKLYLHFSAPMSQGEAYRHVHLFKENGEEIKYPFLELGEELWDANGKRFTLFFDPGRIKRGLKPREEMGPALEEGQRYVFVVDAAWPDAEGNPLRQQFRKSFTVGAPDDAQPDPKAWKFTFPHVATREPLVVVFPEPLDHALVERLLQAKDAAGMTIAGTVTVSEEEKRWEFVPKQPWSAETQYALNVETYLEDLAGNSIAKPFEVDLFNAVDKETRTDVVKIPLPLRTP